MPTRADRIQRLARDWVLLGLGTGGLIHMAATGTVNPWMLGAYLSCLGLPGLVNLPRALRSTGTPGSSSSSPPSSSSSPSSSPSPSESES